MADLGLTCPSISMIHEIHIVLCLCVCMSRRPFAWCVSSPLLCSTLAHDYMYVLCEYFCKMPLGIFGTDMPRQKCHAHVHLHVALCLCICWAIAALSDSSVRSTAQISSAADCSYRSTDCRLHLLLHGASLAIPSRRAIPAHLVSWALCDELRNVLSFAECSVACPHNVKPLAYKHLKPLERMYPSLCMYLACDKPRWMSTATSWLPVWSESEQYVCWMQMNASYGGMSK